MKIWIITDYSAGYSECISVAGKLGGKTRIIGETELRGYMLRRFVQRERGKRDLPEVVISAGAQTEFAAVNMAHEVEGVFNLKLDLPKSRPHMRAFDLIVSDEPPVKLRLSPEEEARVLYSPVFDADKIAAMVSTCRPGFPMPVMSNTHPRADEEQAKRPGLFSAMAALLSGITRSKATSSGPAS